MPNLFIGNLKSDLNGTKMIVLQGSSSGCQLLSNTLEFKNGGRIHGFVLIKSNSKGTGFFIEFSNELNFEMGAKHLIFHLVFYTN